VPDGGKIGEIRKAFGRSLLRSTYEIHGPSGTLTARERNVVVALFRRLVNFIPYVGDFADWLPIPYHFDIGSFRDVYDIDLTGDPERKVDRRLILAAAVGMDALQAR
jgi:hypothetical protein